MHRVRTSVVKAGATTCHFVTDGIESALARAEAATTSLRLLGLPSLHLGLPAAD